VRILRGPIYSSSCGSIDQAEFTTEMIIHFNGLKNIDHPGVLLIQKVTVCVDCGDSRFTTPQAELSQIGERFLRNREPQSRAN
jgi:hypothetical protein